MRWVNFLPKINPLNVAWCDDNEKLNCSFNFQNNNVLSKRIQNEFL